MPLLVKKKPSIFHAKLRRQDSPKRSVVESLRNKYSPVLQRKIFDTDRTRVSPTGRKPISKYHCVTASQQKEGECWIRIIIIKKTITSVFFAKLIILACALFLVISRLMFVSRVAAFYYSSIEIELKIGLENLSGQFLCTTV